MATSAIQIEFLGAAETVTGSRCLLSADGTKSLIDCGLFQGNRMSRQRNWEPFPVEPRLLKRLYLTHAHLDHSGYVPKLVKEGFNGEIWCSEGTAKLCEVLWLDSARLQEEDAQYANRTGHSRHKPAQALYTRKDVDAALKLLHPKSRDEWHTISPHSSMRFRRAGHISGASFLEFQFSDGQETKKICFSGDLGHDRSLTMRCPENPSEADLLVLESTYGDRLHPRIDLLESLQTALNRCFERKGTVVIPSFSVGRAQEVLKTIKVLEDQNKIPHVPVILDSPMAIRATEIYLSETSDHRPESLFSGQEKGLLPRLYEAAESPDESLAACMREGPMVVISAAGMLSGGRVLHHLKNRVQEEKNMVLFVGYQAEGSKGRFLLNYKTQSEAFRIHHQELEVRAEILMIEGFSAHADYEEMGTWVSQFRKIPQRILLNHGEPEALLAFRDYLHRRFNVDVQIAKSGEAIKV